MAADAPADQGDEPAFGILAELIVVSCFFADDEPSAAVAGIKPFRRRGGGPVGAVEAHARAHFDERPALRKFCRFLEFNANQGDALIVLENANGADRYLVASFSLADRAPVSGGEDDQADHQHRRQYDGPKNNEGFFQRSIFPKRKLQRDTLVEKGRSVNPFRPAGLRGPRGTAWIYHPCYGYGRNRPRYEGRDFMETIHSTIVRSPVGPLFLAASNRGLVALEFDARLPGQQTIRPNPRDLRSEAKPAKGRRVRFEESATAMRAYVQQLEEYFESGRREFSFALDLRGTDFQKACWRALLAIPYGETRSYGDIARAVGKPQGFRAVGMANNRNPVAIVVPCHRVIAADGTLCGYGGGLEVKRKLLELEGALSGTLAA